MGSTVPVMITVCRRFKLRGMSWVPQRRDASPPTSPAAPRPHPGRLLACTLRGSAAALALSVVIQHRLGMLPRHQLVAGTIFTPRAVVSA